MSEFYNQLVQASYEATQKALAQKKQELDDVKNREKLQMMELEEARRQIEALKAEQSKLRVDYDSMLKNQNASCSQQVRDKQKYVTNMLSAQEQQYKAMLETEKERMQQKVAAATATCNVRQQAWEVKLVDARNQCAVDLGQQKKEYERSIEAHVRNRESDRSLYELKIQGLREDHAQKIAFLEDTLKSTSASWQQKMSNMKAALMDRERQLKEQTNKFDAEMRAIQDKFVQDLQTSSGNAEIKLRQQQDHMETLRKEWMDRLMVQQKELSEIKERMTASCISQLSAERSQWNKNFEALKGEIKAKQNTLLDLNGELKVLQRQVTALKLENSQYSKEGLDKLKAQHRAALKDSEKQYNDVNRVLERTKSELESEQQKLQNLRGAEELMRRQLKDAGIKQTSMQSQVAKLNGQTKALQKRVEDLVEEKRKLEVLKEEWMTTEARLNRELKLKSRIKSEEPKVVFNTDSQMQLAQKVAKAHELRTKYEAEMSVLRQGIRDAKAAFVRELGNSTAEDLRRQFQGLNEEQEKQIAVLKQDLAEVIKEKNTALLDLKLVQDKNKEVLRWEEDQMRLRKELFPRERFEDQARDFLSHKQAYDNANAPIKRLKANDLILTLTREIQHCNALLAEFPVCSRNDVACDLRNEFRRELSNQIEYLKRVIRVLEKET